MRVPRIGVERRQQGYAFIESGGLRKVVHEIWDERHEDRNLGSDVGRDYVVLLR